MTTWKKSCVAIIAILALITTACGRPLASDEQRPETVQRYAQERTAGDDGEVQMLQGTGEAQPLPGNQHYIPLVTDGGTYYVPLLQLTEAMGYNYEWNEETKTYEIGYTDPIYTVPMNSTQVTKEETTLTLPKQTLMINGAPYLPLEGFNQLFQEEINYTVQGGKILLTPEIEDGLMNPEVDTPTDESLNFGDDPSDPAGDTEVWGPIEDSQLAEPVLKNINITRMLSTAKKYLGVKYKFGAKAYSSSYKRFDCSSYTRFIFGKYGISLPRTARAQAKKGTTVSRKNLRKGDLLYFYVPGRFKSSKTIGHVGIYIGKNRMIHASPEPKNGVQITNINKAFWKKTFLKAKRIAY